MALSNISRALKMAAGGEDPLDAENATLTKQLEDATASLATATSRITDLEALVTAAGTENTELSGQVTALTASLAAEKTARDTAEKTAAKAKTDADAAISANEASVKAKVSSGVIDAMAAMGQPGSNLPKPDGTPAGTAPGSQNNQPARELSGVEIARAQFTKNN